MNNVRVHNSGDTMVPVAFQQVAVDGATALGTLNADTKAVKITVATAAIRVTFDGTTPVGGTTGHYYAANASDTWSRAMAAGAKMIKDGGSAAEVSATEVSYC
jgi:hypothetical protein